MIENNSHLLKSTLYYLAAQDGSETHAIIALKHLEHVLSKYNVTLKNKVILEMGSYSHPGFAFLLLLLGAKKIILNNITDVHNILPREYVHNIIFLLQLHERTVADVMDIVDFDDIGKYVRIKPHLIEVIPNTDCCDIRLEAGSIDILLTSSVLEHVTRLSDAIKHMSKLMKPGGWCYHGIDIRDHRDFTRPLEFLKLSESEYRGAGYTDNRHRASQYVEIFHKEGLYPLFKGYTTPLPVNTFGTTDMYFVASQPIENIVHETYQDVPVWVTEHERTSLDQEFRDFSQQELSVTGLSLLCHKPG